MNITLATNHVLPGEPCLALIEVNQQVPRKGLRRIQVIHVVRADTPWRYERDLGPARRFKADAVAIRGNAPLGNGRFAVVETVERMQAMADEWRSEAIVAPVRQQEPTDFKKMTEEYLTRRREARTGLKRFAT